MPRRKIKAMCRKILAPWQVSVQACCRDENGRLVAPKGFELLGEVSDAQAKARLTIKPKRRDLAGQVLLPGIDS